MKSAKQTNRLNLSHKLTSVVLAMLMVVMLCSCIKAPEPLPEGTLEVTFIDVGQAESALILCDGESVLIDGGNNDDASLVYSILRNKGIDRLNYIVNTHPDEDHVGGLAGALNYAKVDVCLAPTDEYDTQTFRNFKKYLAEQNVPITTPNAGDTFSIGSAKVTVLTAPSQGYQDDDDGLVIFVTHGKNTFLFTGDISSKVEKLLVADALLTDIDVLSVAHHGSNSSTSYEFLRYTNPRYAIISVGKGNPYGHPHEEPLARLRDQGAQLYRTDMQGNIVFTSDGESIVVETEREAQGDLYVDG